ncbi:MAG: hypothetical protein WCV91_05525, partial [Candidatus Margulisiibacteriota bacterium]
MTKALKGVYNGYSGPTPRHAQHLKNVLEMHDKRRSEARSAAQIEAWQMVWTLPEVDPSEISWVGLDDPSNFGKARVVSEELRENPFNPSLITHSNADPLDFGCCLADEKGKYLLPLPMVTHEMVAFPSSGLEHYPISCQGFIGQESPTRTVHSLNDFLMFPSVLPENYHWIIPHIPVYSMTVFVPIPKARASDAASFDADYCFFIRGGRRLIVHRIVEDRCLPGYLYEQKPEGVDFSFHNSLIRITDNTLADGVPSHSLFRAEKAPSLAKNIDAPSVFGRFVFLVMQQEKDRPRASFSDSFSPFKFAGIEVSPSRVVAGRTLEPINYGEGVRADFSTLPTIFSIQVLAVQDVSEMIAGNIDLASRVFP